MGVDIQTYRSRIGKYRQGRGHNVVTFTVTCNFSQALKQIGSVVFIGILLLLAGIEQNPGPFPEEGQRTENDTDQEDSGNKHTSDETQAVPRLHEEANDVSTESSDKEGRRSPTLSKAAAAKLNSRELEDKNKAETYDQPVQTPEKCTPGVTDFENILCKFNLQDFYPEKISISKVMEITEDKRDLSIGDIPWIILRKLIMIDFKARDDIFGELLKPLEYTESVPQGKRKKSRKERSKLEHPLDFFLVIFVCCDVTLKHIIFDRLSICRLAFPIIYSVINNDRVLPLSCIRGLNIEWDNMGGNVGSFSLIDYPMKIVSFIRLGRPGASKSRYVNVVLSDENHSTFFNKESIGGKTNRLLANGMIESSWFLPSGKHNQVFPEPLLFCNLRGDAITYYNQLDLLLQTSSIIVVFLELKSLGENERRFITKINTAKVPVLNILTIEKDDDESDGEEENIIKRCNKHSKVLYVYTDEGVDPESRNEIRVAIKDFLPVSENSSLSKFRDKSKNFQVKCDEDDETCNQGKHLAEKLISLLGDAPIQTLKHTHLTTQKSAWMEYTTLLKQNHKSSESMREQGKLNDALKLLSRECGNPTTLVTSFIDVLLQHHEQPKVMTHFIYWLSLFLDQKSKTGLPDLRKNFHKTWQKLKIAEEHQKSDEIKRLKDEAVKADCLLSEATFGFEHIVRELGHMYESIILCPDDVEPGIHEDILKIPRIMAKLLISGQCFELMDGDTASVPINWIKAVMNETINLIGNAKVVVLSVIGIQSSGKSTLLNAMFGLRFSVSAGRCTRGIYMQLIPICNTNIDAGYLVVIDTEGLRALELAGDKHNHDNELATFVIGMAEITIVNIKGENKAEIKDILQIVVHAFLRLRAANNNLKLNKSCVFIHQNVSSVNAKETLMHEKQAFINLLNHMAKEAAHQENIAEITTFKQVIHFDDNDHIWYYSDLWKGDPPMAPANTGYSEMVQETKQTIFQSIVPSRQPFLLISNWITHVTDLWNGILGENFVFAFRNCLEIRAYNNMEATYIKLRWDLEKYVTTWIQEQSVQSKRHANATSLNEFISTVDRNVV